MPRFLVFAICLTSPAIGADKLPVPPDAALEGPLALIKEVYGEEHANAKTNEKLQALAKKLLSEASKTEKPIDRYALLRVARDIAIQSCDAQTAFQIIEEMDRTFQVDAVNMKASVLHSLTKKARLPADRQAIAEQALALIDLAVARDDFELSGKLAEMALSEAKKVRDAAYVKSVAARSNEIEELSRAYTEVRAAAEKLEDDPTDSEANLVVGRYRCLVKGDWENGLPMLALGSDAVMKDLAVKELGRVAKPEEQVALGDIWWELAEEEKGTKRRRLKERAAHWYREALHELSGLDKSKAERRLAEATKILAPALESSQPMSGLVGTWRVTYTKRTVRRYEIAADGRVFILHISGPYPLAGRVEGKVSVRPDGIFIAFMVGKRSQDRRLERWNVQSLTKAKIEHYVPHSPSPTQHATAERVAD